MKFTPLFISAGISCAVLFGCNQPQKQESTNKTDDIVWKASLSYCLTNDKLDWQGLRDGYDMDNCVMYNFNITEEKGDFKKLMKLFYDSTVSKTYQIYNGNPANGMNPEYPISAKEKHNYFPDSIWNNEHTKLLSTGNYFQYIKGFSINHELLFDSKTGSLNSIITDGDPLAYGPFNSGDYMLSVATLKFCNRINDSMGTDQPGFKPEILWAREILMPLVDSGNGIQMMNNQHWIKMDSLSRYALNDKSYISSAKYPVVIKSMFDKSLAEWILIAARNGQLQAFKYIDGDKVGDMISANELKTMNTIVDTFPDEHGIKKGYPHRLGAEELTGLELKEEIAFHQSTFSFESKITYAGILVEVKDKNTHKPIRNTSTLLYWVKLN